MKLLSSLTCYPDTIKKPGYYPGSVVESGRCKKLVLKDKIVNVRKIYSDYQIYNNNFCITILIREFKLKIKVNDEVEVERQYQLRVIEEEQLMDFVFRNKFNLSDFESYFNLMIIPIKKLNYEITSYYSTNNNIDLYQDRCLVGTISLSRYYGMPVYELRLNETLIIEFNEGGVNISIKSVEDNTRITRKKKYSLIGEFPLNDLVQLINQEITFKRVEDLLNL